MKEIIYTPIKGKYLPSEVVSQCFIEGKHTFVDKTLCGNGFTTSALANRTIGSWDVIIAPNQAVVKSKQEKDNSMDSQYIYGGSKHTLDIEVGEGVVFIVVDSFLHNIDHFIKHSSKIGKILIDEAHSVVIQSEFRPLLQGFQKYVTKLFPDKAIVSVTATPMLFQQVDIKLTSNAVKIPSKVFLTENQESSLERLKIALNDGRRVTLATQDVRFIKRLVGDGELEANFKVGDNLMRSIVEFIPNIVTSETSNLTIISSKGFEGFDIDNGINDVFIVEDRTKEYTTFFPQNIVQILGRPREGAGYIEWCMLPNTKRKKVPSLSALKKKANSKKISQEKKFSDKNYRDIQTYYSTIVDYDTGLATSLLFNEDKYNLDVEMLMFDEVGVKLGFEDFFADRGYELVDLNEQPYRFGVKGVKPSQQKMFDNVKTNSDIVMQLNLMSDITPDSSRKDKIDKYILEYKQYLRRRFWNLEELPFTEQEISDKEAALKNINTVAYNDSMLCLSMLSDEVALDKAINEILKNKKQEKREELGRRSLAYKKWLDDYEISIKDRFVRLMIALSDNRIDIPVITRNHRDYSILTEVSMSLITTMMTDLYNSSVIEYDINTANPRILHAIIGKTINENFYINNKLSRNQTKTKVNTLLNSLSKDTFDNSWTKDNLRMKKSRLKDSLKEVGFDEDMAEYLINTYWNKHKDSLFNTCTYHEKIIIDKLKNKFQMELDDIEVGVSLIRRHDSILAFGNFDRTILDSIAKDFMYLKQNNWFKI